MSLDLSGIIPARKPAATVQTVATRTSSRSERGGRRPLYFDLETAPDEERLHQFGLDPLPEPRPRMKLEECAPPADFIAATVDNVKAMLKAAAPCDEWIASFEALEVANKNRKGVLEAIAELRDEAAAIAAATEERQKLLSVTPEFNRIVAAGWSHGDDAIFAAIAGNGGTTEKRIVEILWEMIESATVVIGFNILGFDLPTLFVRSAILGIKPRRRLDLKPWGSDCLDLMKVRFPSQQPKGFGLKSLARAYGIPVPAGETDGGDVYRLWKAKEFGKIAEYVKSDVEITVKLHQMYRGYFCS